MKQEWERTFGIFTIALFILFFASDWGFATTSLAIFEQNLITCVLDYYPMWLLIYGIMIVSQNILLVIFGIWLLLSLFVTCVRAWFAEFAICIVISGGILLNFIWHIVGSVYFFIDIVPNCSSDITIYQFALALFIVKSLIFTLFFLKIFICHIPCSSASLYS